MISNLIPTKVMDKNGKLTTVHKKQETAGKAGKNVTAPLLGGGSKVNRLDVDPKTGKYVLPNPTIKIEGTPSLMIVPEYAGDHDIVQRIPKNFSEAKRFLTNPRGENHNAVRHIILEHNISAKTGIAEDIPVVGPNDGRPLIIAVNSGLPRLRVDSGKVIIFADSAWGNSVDATGDSDVTVIVQRGCKISTETKDNAKMRVICRDQNVRGYQRVSANGELTIEGGGEHIGATDDYEPLRF